MLKRKVATAGRLFRAGGMTAVFDQALLRMQLLALAKAKKKKVRLDGCTINLEGIPDGETKVYLLTHRYEAPERRAVAQYIRRDLPVIELGGSIGVVACMTNKLLRDPAAHLVVEANPLAIPRLRSNREANRCGFEIVNRAIAYDGDSVTFCPSSDMCANSITAAGDLPSVTVQTAQLGDLARGRGFGAFSLVCDIEGLEYDLVCHEADVLKRADTIIMETHARLIGEDKLRFMMDKLHDLGFRIVERTGFVVVLRQ